MIDDEWFKGKEENDYKQKLIATEERYDTLTKTSVEALEKKNERIKKLQTENEKLKATLAIAEEQGGKKMRDAIINVMSNRNYMGVSYEWAAFSDNDINNIFNEVFNNDKK